MEDFRIKRRSVKLLADIILACKNQERVTVYDADTDTSFEGTARHIVGPNDFMFPDTLTPDCRLRISGAAEVFVPLRRIEDWAYDEQGLWLTVASLVGQPA